MIPILASADINTTGEGANQLVTIANQFGVMPHMLIAQIINFTLVAWIFWALVLKPITAKLDERAKTIDEGVKKAHESQTILKEARTQSEDIIKNAYHESQTILEDTKKQATEMAERARAQTKKETQEMVEAARKSLILQQEQFMNESKARLATMVIEVAQKALGEDLLEEQRNRYNQRAAESFK